MADPTRTLKRPPDPYAAECGERLRLVRKALGFEEMKPFAKHFSEVTLTMYSWEIGTAMVPPRFTLKLKAEFNVGFNWIYAGDMGDMPSQVRMDVLAIKNRLASAH